MYLYIFLPSSIHALSTQGLYTLPLIDQRAEEEISQLLTPNIFHVTPPGLFCPQLGEFFSLLSLTLGLNSLLFRIWRQLLVAMHCLCSLMTHIHSLAWNKNSLSQRNFNAFSRIWHLITFSLKI